MNIIVESKLLMTFQQWDNSYCDEESLISLIDGADQIISKYGRWPTFSSAEVLDLKIIRGTLLNAMRSGKWEDGIPPSMVVNFYLLDERYDERDSRSNSAIVQIEFKGLHSLELEGFNYQNAICGLGVRREVCKRINKELFCVSWGGAAIKHDVYLTCESISISVLQDISD